MVRSRIESQSEGGQWPYASLLLFGYFGADEPAGRRLALRTTIALAVIVVALIALQFGLAPVLRAVCALLIPASVAAIVWENTVYARTLDELSRALQLTAFAIAYGCAMLFGSAYFALLLAFPAVAVQLGATGFMTFLIVAEPVRGMALVRLAKRHA